jgi:type IV pilus biogenesis protein CpaD/CtpE
MPETKSPWTASGRKGIPCPCDPYVQNGGCSTQDLHNVQNGGCSTQDLHNVQNAGPRPLLATKQLTTSHQSPATEQPSNRATELAQSLVVSPV